MSEQATMQQPSPDEQPQEAKQQERQGGGRERGRRRRHGQHGGQPQPSTPGQQRRPEASLNMDELRDLVQLIAEHGFTDFELEREGFRVRLRRELTPQIISAPAVPIIQPQVVGQPAQAIAAMEAGAADTASSAQGAATQSQPKHPGAEAEAAASSDEGLYIIPSPIVGTFYRSPSPTAEPFVRIGSHVGPDTIVCIIEAMKLMNEIQAETAGEIAKIYVENGQPVEYGQPLFGIKQ